jgi:hypothetical protein
MNIPKTTDNMDDEEFNQPLITDNQDLEDDDFSEDYYNRLVTL